MKQEVRQKFLTNTNETGRFIVYSPRTGRTYAVEPIDDGSVRTEWGSIDPATKEMVNKKGHDKYTGSITEEESLITEENGFKNIKMYGPGYSPHAIIEHLDAQYPDLVV